MKNYLILFTYVICGLHINTHNLIFFCYKLFRVMDTITLLDADTNLSYNLNLSIEDAQRAKEDLQFAEALLRHAKINFKGRILIDETNTISEAEPEASTSSENLLHEKKMWSYDDTLNLLDCVEAHYEDMHNPKKKKNFWVVVSTQLESLQTSMTPAECLKKWQNLVRTYKVCKDTKGKTGRGPTRFGFFTKMDGFLGSQPSNCSPHSIDVQILGEASTSGCQQEENTTSEKENVSVEPTTAVEPHKKRRNATLEYFEEKKNI